MSGVISFSAGGVPVSVMTPMMSAAGRLTRRQSDRQL